MNHPIMILKMNKEDVHISKDEGLRYIGYRKNAPVEEIEKKAQAVVEKMADVIDPRVCYLEVPVKIRGDEVDFGVIQVHASGLAKHLSGCCKAILFAATTGARVDREIARFSKLSVFDGLLYDAMGSAAIEAVCNAACDVFEKMAQDEGMTTRTRYSPGYGGLDIDTQKDFLQVLDSNRKIGLSLTEGMMMTPVKSVSAIVGISELKQDVKNSSHKSCANCDLKDCAFRNEE